MKCGKLTRLTSIFLKRDLSLPRSEDVTTLKLNSVVLFLFDGKLLPLVTIVDIERKWLNFTWH